ncbi:hypothetical protein [Candidatus Uabimicrobium sp. HlEnr_7]|uniref:hypothetical protein n=1 Tax=Candidatus Uabimicrobium helgolandensis TaxID=3095367 RepID=UPI003555EF57
MIILFHGTIEENVKKIKKEGLLDNTTDQWILEVTQRNVCCVSNQPSSGEGGNAAYFAYRNPKIKNQNGYLVVIEIPEEIYRNKIIAIFDNKILDDYVKFHFFIREEFRNIGYELFSKLRTHREQHKDFTKLDEITKRQGNEQDRLIVSPSDQRLYNKHLKENERYIYQILGIEITDEFWNFIEVLGKWETLYQFLHIHFANIDAQKYQNFCKDAPNKLDQFWRSFYTSFPLQIDDLRHEYFKDWFSPNWLDSRRLTKETNNCQILTEAIELQHILGFIKITTPSGFAGDFRSSRLHGGFASLVWKEVDKLWE